MVENGIVDGSKNIQKRLLGLKLDDFVLQEYEFVGIQGQVLQDFDPFRRVEKHDPDRVIAALKLAMQRGFRDSRLFADPIFEDMWDEPRFVALQQELDTILTAEHDKVLQLICFNNPVPGDWQPLPETCEGVEEQLVL